MKGQLKALILILVILGVCFAAYSFANKLTGLVTQISNLNISISANGSIDYFPVFINGTTLKDSLMYQNISELPYASRLFVNYTDTYFSDISGENLALTEVMTSDSVNTGDLTVQRQFFVNQLTGLRNNASIIQNINFTNYAKVNMTNTTGILAPEITTVNMTMNSTGLYWLQGSTCKMRQYYNGTHWVTTGTC